jgi:hypothetical protein
MSPDCLIVLAAILAAVLPTRSCGRFTLIFAKIFIIREPIRLLPIAPSGMGASARSTAARAMMVTWFEEKLLSFRARCFID